MSGPTTISVRARDCAGFRGRDKMDEGDTLLTHFVFLSRMDSFGFRDWCKFPGLDGEQHNAGLEQANRDGIYIAPSSRWHWGLEGHF